MSGVAGGHPARNVFEVVGVSGVVSVKFNNVCLWHLRFETASPCGTDNVTLGQPASVCWLQKSVVYMYK